jgi:hypothetical protein
VCAFARAPGFNVPFGPSCRLMIYWLKAYTKGKKKRHETDDSGMSQNQHWTVTLPSLFFRSVPCTRATVVYSGPSKARKSWNRAFSTHGWIDDINSSSWHFKREKKNGKRKTANAYTHTSPFCPMSRNGSVRPFCVCMWELYYSYMGELKEEAKNKKKN